MNLLVKNIGMLVGIDESGRLKVEGKAMADIATLESAWLLTDGERIKDYGTMDSCPSGEGCDILDAEGGWLFPSFCDSHTHIVFAGSREQEFLDKINGLSYEEIAKRGYTDEQMVQLMYSPQPANWPDYPAPMPPMAHVPKADALKIAAYINSLAK